MSQYKNPAMKQLADQQVRYAPREVRLNQIEQAEKVVSTIDPQKTYRYPDLCEQVTFFRPEMYPDMVLSGEEAIHDLRCFVEDVSGSANITIDSVSEPVLTVQEVSARYNVSTKTVDRWRNRGLCSRRFMFGKRKRIGFLESSVERFVSKHASEISKSARFSQLTVEERREIVRRARKLARYGGCPSDVSRRLARKLNRSPETIRYTLKNYDQEHPELAVFPHASSPLTEEKRREIYHDFRRGIPAERLANQNCRTKTSIYRIISEVRAERLLGQKIDFMDSPQFHLKNAEEVILADPPEVDKSKSITKSPPGLPPYLASLYAIPLLTREEEAHYFRKMNFLKCRAATLRDQLDPARPKASGMDEVENLLEDAIAVKNFLIRSNLRLVVSIAKKHIKPGGNFFEMVSDGNMSLIRAIEKFDYMQGNKFSTYASWAIMKNFARTIPKEYTRLDRFRTGKDEVFVQSTDVRANPFQEELVNRNQHQAIMDILDQLDERERDIIRFRFGLDYNQEPLTLEQVGNHFGVTKERIRQIESRALKKLRKIAVSEKLDIPGI
ncbi:RNA polymerase sigma factor RpoD [hydrothermal vent metagenome]|uniref:RNA polymerase sigma factor RpoD n=1 Tax=hydrothermal vent metagenome TaxID=652676 RepID=A0A3B1DN84_9ZZZZ